MLVQVKGKHAKWRNPTCLKDNPKKRLREYSVWYSILERTVHNNGRFKPYLGVSVCDEWLSYDNFYEFTQTLKNWNSFDHNGKLFQMDKDVKCLMLNCDKVYSPETCIMLPNVINSQLSIPTTTKIKYHELPFGVTRHRVNGFYDVLCKKYRRYRRHKTPQEAQEFLFLKKQEDFLRALTYYRSMLDIDVYDFLVKLDIKEYYKSNGVDILDF